MFQKLRRQVTALRPIQLHPPLNIHGGCLRQRHQLLHCLPINAISSAVLVIVTLCVQQHVIMATTVASVTGGTDGHLASIAVARSNHHYFGIDCSFCQGHPGTVPSIFLKLSVHLQIPHLDYFLNVKWGRITEHFSSQAADTIHACSDKLWNGFELTFDPIESFSSLGALVNDRIESFSDAIVQDLAPVGAPAHVESMLEGFMFDRVSTCNSKKVDDDGFITTSLARSSVGETILDTMSDVPCTDHSATQGGFAQTLVAQKPQFTWKQDNFLSAVFGMSHVVDDLFPHMSLKRPASLPINLTGDKPGEAQIQKMLKKGHFRALRTRAVKQSAIMREETQRANCMVGWISIVLLTLFTFAASDKARCGNAETELCAVVYTTAVGCVARKAASTVGKKLDAIKRFAEFCTARTFSAFPLDDSGMHAYLLFLSNDAHARGSSGKSFLESVRFTRSMLDLRSREVWLVSQRVSGLADSIVKRASVVEQARALTIAQIEKVELACCISDSLQDRALQGGALLVIYSSGRDSDIARAIKLLVDRDVKQLEERDANEPEGFLERVVLGNQGARSDAHRRMLLPMVALMLGLSGTKWWDEFLEACMALGFETESKLKWLLLCRFDSSGQPLEQNPTASEVREPSHQCLDTRTGTGEVRCCAEPLMQCTTLSWLAKYSAEPPIRRLVGRHLDAGSKSAETYSRGSMAPTLRRVRNNWYEV